MTGPAPGGRMEDAGFKKKNGCLGFALFNSVIWSLEFTLAYNLHVTMQNLRIISADTHDFGSFL